MSGGAGSEVGDVLAALADPTRQRVLDTLAAHGEATATVVAAELPVSRQEVRYAVRPERLDTAARWISELAAEWDARLARIKRLAESDPSRGDP